MSKQKTGFWKAHPLLKAITVLVLFFGVLLVSAYCPLGIPIFGMVFYVFDFFYVAMGVYFFGVLYGIWLELNCHLKIISFCFVLLLLIVFALIDFFILYIYPDWKRNGYLDWKYIYSSAYIVYTQILSVVVGYILSRVISYFVAEHRKARGITN